MERERFLYLFRLLKQLAADHGGPRRAIHPDHVIVAIFLWAALWDRSVLWASCRQNWPACLRRFSLPSQSCMSRRLRSPTVLRLFDALANALSQQDQVPPIKIIDAKPLPVSRHSQDPDATFGRGAGGLNKGYKLYAIWPEKQAIPLSWEVQPMNVSEPKVGHRLVERLNDRGYLLGDRAYDVNHFYDAAGQHGQQLLAHRRFRNTRNLGHIRHSKYRVRAFKLLTRTPFQRLLKKRRTIETRFAHLVGFGGGLTHLPPWVRRLHRVRLWVLAKLIINAARILEKRRIANVGA